MKTLKYLSLFSGYGGFELGIQQANGTHHLRSVQQKDCEGSKELHDSPDKLQQWECVGFSEIDKYATQVYQKHFPYEECEKCRIENERQSKMSSPRDSERQSGEQSHDGTKGLACNCKHKPYGDITKLDFTTLPDFELLVGGFPCQSFSIAGKRGGVDDARGTLFYEVARIAKAKKPRLLLLENVKGLLSSGHRNTGIFYDKSTKTYSTEQTRGSNEIKIGVRGETLFQIQHTLAELDYMGQAGVLNSKNFGVPQNRERVFIVGHLGGFGGRQVFPLGAGNEVNTQSDGQGNAYCLQAGGDKHRGTYITQRSRGKNAGGAKNICPTVSSHSFQDNNHLVNGAKIRRLTPTECERLMGLPDGWTAEGTEGKISDSQRYKLCGNGVVVDVVREIIKKMYIYKSH